MIDYALAKGAVVVAGQGNDSSSGNFYPADYNGVLSVGWLDTGVGVKTVNPRTNYGEKVQVFAPGSNIYSTWQRPTQASPAVYKAASGSSCSTPLVSGLAGLVWSKFPSYTPRQIVKRIRVTSDKIDAFNSASYRGLLGHGVINPVRAVNDSITAVSVRADSVLFRGRAENNGLLAPGDEISVTIFFSNLLGCCEYYENLDGSLCCDGVNFG